MSGGSFEYLCHKDVGELLDSSSELERMADALACLGYADDAAAESRAVLMELLAFRIRMDVSLGRLFEVWKAYEWWQSADWGEDSVREALVLYRGMRHDFEPRNYEGRVVSDHYRANPPCDTCGKPEGFHLHDKEQLP